jgi:hypothetical protein
MAAATTPKQLLMKNYSNIIRTSARVNDPETGVHEI